MLSEFLSNRRSHFGRLSSWARRLPWRLSALLQEPCTIITVYADGRVVGHAVYDSLGGSGNLGKFINAEAKIKELVDQLFVNPASGG